MLSNRKKLLSLNFIIILLIASSSACSDDESAIQNNIVGTWELVKIDDSVNGRDYPPNDNKPVTITFYENGTHEGTAGNNDLSGEYDIRNGMIEMTLFTTEIANTEWETKFMVAIQDTWSENKYIIDYLLEVNELTLQYNEESHMTFIRK